MSHLLKLHDVIVGRTELGAVDPGTQVARAPFRPGLGWELVEPIFALAREPREGEGADATDADRQRRRRYMQARDTLALALYAPDGALLETTRIDITTDAASPTGLVIEVRVVQR
jgi:hypothetical protein